jgi:hypothetical protein
MKTWKLKIPQTRKESREDNLWKMIPVLPVGKENAKRFWKSLDCCTRASTQGFVIGGCLCTGLPQLLDGKNHPHLKIPSPLVIFQYISVRQYIQELEYHQCSF